MAGPVLVHNPICTGVEAVDEAEHSSGLVVTEKTPATKRARDSTAVGKASNGQKRKQRKGRSNVAGEHAVSTQTVAFPSNAKLIGPVHHRPATNCADSEASGFRIQRNTTNGNQLSRNNFEATARQVSLPVASPSRYQWQAGESGGGVYCKKSFWNLHRATHSRCPSAVSTRTSISMHSQGSHLSLHQSKPVHQHEMDDYLRISQPLSQSPSSMAQESVKARCGPGSFSQYFMCFKPRRQQPAALSFPPLMASTTHHSRNDNSVLLSLRIQPLETGRSASSRLPSGRLAPRHSHSRHLSPSAGRPGEEVASVCDSVVSIQPAARPCTPATVSYRTRRQANLYGLDSEPLFDHATGTDNITT